MSDETPVQVTDNYARSLRELAARCFDASLSVDREKFQGDVFDAEVDRLRGKAEAEFKREVDRRLSAAYRDGARTAVSRDAQNATLARSVALFFVVGALVATPILAMWLKLPPETFGAYIAPVTGIAGTIVGYWFGSGERRSTS